MTDEAKQKATNAVAKVIHDLVSSEIERVDEEKRGLIRRDGGRELNEAGIALHVVEMVLWAAKRAK